MLRLQVGVEKRGGCLLDPEMVPGIALAGRVVGDRIGESVVLGVLDFYQELVSRWEAVERRAGQVRIGSGCG